MRGKWSHYLRAQIRDIRVLLQESRLSIILFAIILLVGAFVFFFFYINPESGQRPTFIQSLHATFAMIFFELTLPFPSVWYVQIFYFVIPILGLVIIVDGLLRFGTALFNKQSRGQKWQVAMASTYQNHVIVCGMGKVGYRITQELLKFERDIVAIEIDSEGRFVEKAQNMGIPLILADARRSDNLLKANITQADAIIPCTADELTNLEIALDARELNPNIKVVMRMFDPDLAQRVERGFGIHTAFSTSALAAPIFATAALRLDVKTSFYVGEQLLNLGEIKIVPESRLIGRTVAQMESELDLSFICYRDDECELLHPDPQQQMNPNATILVIASIRSLFRLNELNRPAN